MSSVVFYTCYLQEAELLKDVTDNIHEVLCGIIDRHAIKSDGCSTLDVGADGFSAFLDVIKNSDTYLFGRLGKEKDLNSVGLRDKNTMQHSSVLDEKDAGVKMLEATTYFLLDYKDGIISFINGREAPRIGCLANAVQNYDSKYVMTFNSIVSPESVKSLMKSGSSISRIKYSFALPSIDVLENMGLNRNQLASLRGLDTYEAEIVVKGKPRKFLSSDNSTINGIIQAFDGDKGNLKKILFSGKEPNSNTKNYSYEDMGLQYNIAIVTSKTENGVETFYNPNEIAEKIYDQLALLYQQHKQSLMSYCGKI